MKTINTEYNNQKLFEKKQIKRDSNKYCALLLISIVIMQLTAVAIQLLLMIFDSQSTINSLMSSLISGISECIGLFIVGVIFLLITKQRFEKVFRFEKINKLNTTYYILIGLAICILSNYIVYLLNMNLSLFGYESRSTNEEIGNDFLSIFLSYLSVALIPALVEEFMFRGIVLSSLRKYGDGFAIIISSLLFAIMHGSFVQIPFTFIIALCLGYIVCKTNSMIPAIILHFLNNTYSISMSIVSENTSSNTANIIMLIVAMIIIILGIISFILLSNKERSFLKLDNINITINSFASKLQTYMCTPFFIAFVALLISEAVFLK